MNLHKIIDITEADFGCEEHLDGPHAVLVFEDGDRLEVSEMWIAEQGIKEGKYIWIREDGSYLKAVRVVGAIIEAEKKTGDKTEKMIFATQRGYGDFKDGWEFPGGKIEDGETPEEAIVREIKEELDTDIKVESYVDTIEYDYPEFHLSMDCFLCSIIEGDLVLKEHEAAKWLTKATLDTVDGFYVGSATDSEERLKAYVDFGYLLSNRFGSNSRVRIAPFFNSFKSDRFEKYSGKKSVLV